MKHLIAATTLAAALAQPASATTFPTLTTIYVGAGVTDDGSGSNAGIATSFICLNVSGVTASVRFLVLDTPGSVAGSLTTTVNHGATFTASTHLTVIFADNSVSPAVDISQGGVNIESTQSGVFCTAAIVDAAGDPPTFSMPLVRINGHPGPEE